MAGIERIHISDTVSGRGSWRFRWSQERWPAANSLYRQVFTEMGSPLLPEDADITCTMEEFDSGYDHALGIDVFLRFACGMTATLQEKFLSYKYSTVTVEYMQNPSTGEQGDWFNLKAQYYFVGYDRDGSKTFQDWILLDWPAVMRCTQQGRILWSENRNKQDGARASFRYVHFDNVPAECVVARYAGAPPPGH